MKALIDGDIVAYRCAAAHESDDLGLAIWQTDELVRRILAGVDASTYSIWLSGTDNFRYRIYSAYKANRIGKPRPVHWEPIKQHLVLNWGAKVSYGCEADDMLGCEQDLHTIICSIDKDLKQIAGLHYNFVKQEIFIVTQERANYAFWTQMLVGDTSDNIVGIPGIGVAKAARILANSNHFPESVLSEYVHSFWVDGIPQFKINAKLLRIWHKPEDEHWEQELPAVVVL